MDPVAVRIVRGETVESVHRVSLAVADAQGRLRASFGDPGRLAFLRSAAKPMQALPFVESGAADRFGFTPAELAIACGSHGGEPEHVRVVEGMLKKIALGPDALQCGRHAPYHAPSAEAVGGGYTPLHHNCSGKHAGMLAVALHLGADPRRYLDPTGPVQRAILAAVAEETGVPATKIAQATDGCGVPSFAVPLAATARAFARLGDPESVAGDRGRSLRRIQSAMVGYPRLVAGTERLDTDFMAAFGGKLIVKAGAEACYGAAMLGPGLGVCIKVEDGAARAVGPVLVRVLEHVGFITKAQKDAVARHWSDPLRNVAGKAVGRIECDMELQAPRGEVVGRA